MTVEEVASLYIRLLTHVSDLSSRVNVLGHSFGAVIAHRMAYQLEARGVSVTLLLGDFEVAYPPERFSSWRRTSNVARVFIGAWEGAKIEEHHHRFSPPSPSP